MVVPIGRPTGVAARTRIVDAEVALALGRGITQIVLLGAGYDGRALPFGGQAVRWFEVDLPSTQADERRRLAALRHRAGRGRLRRRRPHERRSRPEAASTAPATTRPHRHSSSARGCWRPSPSRRRRSVCQTLRARAAPASVLVGSFLVAPAPSAPARALRWPPTRAGAPLANRGAGSSAPGIPRSSWSSPVGWVTHALAGGRLAPWAHPRACRASPGGPDPGERPSWPPWCSTPGAPIARRPGRTQSFDGLVHALEPRAGHQGDAQQRVQSESGMSQPLAGERHVRPVRAHQTPAWP